MSNKPSPGALDFARRHGLPEPRTATEAVEMMREHQPRIPLYKASWRDHWALHQQVALIDNERARSPWCNNDEVEVSVSFSTADAQQQGE